jgi:hypothetical protein
MPLQIPQDVRDAVVRDWLKGKPRDTIAFDNSLGAGSVSSIISEWGNALTLPVAEDLRGLGIMLRKSGITASECASGFRLASIIKEMGVDEDNFGHFISEVYNKSKDIGLQPDYIANNIKQLLDLAGAIPLSEIPEYIEKKISQKQKLEEDIKKLEEKQLDARTTLALALDENKVYLTELEEFSNLKAQLDKHGIPVEDLQRTIKIIQGVQKSGYNVETITGKLSDWEAWSAIQAKLQKENESLQKEYDRLSELVLTHQQNLSLCEQLQVMGFGFKQLKLLHGIIMEVAAANNIAPDMAVQKFFQDIEKNYDNKLGYDSKLGDLRSEINKTNTQLILAQKHLSAKNHVALALNELIMMGFNDQEILNLAYALQSNISNKESLQADLNKYGNLKRLIEELTEESRIIQSTAMESIGFTRRLNMRIDLLPFLVEAAGDMHQDNRLSTAIVDTTKLALTNPDVFKGINRLHSSDSARVLSDEHEDDKPSVDKGDQQT